MSQKSGKRTRRHVEDTFSIPEKKDETVPEKKDEIIPEKKDETISEKKDETEDNVATVNTNDEINSNGTEACENSTKSNDKEEELQTKDSEDISKTTEEHSQSTGKELSCEDIVEKENSEKSDRSKTEQLESENEMESLVVEEPSNGVEILVETSGEKSTEEKEEEVEKGNILVDENIVNGESHSDTEESKAENNDGGKVNGTEDDITENIDGKSSYNFEDVNNTLQSEQICTDTFADISTRAVAGSDTTRFEENFEFSKFLAVSKDQSVGESLRHLSARRSIRTMKNYFPVDGNMYNLNQCDVRKRKLGEDTSQDSKRAKKDSPGLMSYLGYPFKKPDMASSTPKLTGYRENSFDNNVSKISLNNSNEKPSNKWCSVM